MFTASYQALHADYPLLSLVQVLILPVICVRVEFTALTPTYLPPCQIFAPYVIIMYKKKSYEIGNHVCAYVDSNKYYPILPFSVYVQVFHIVTLKLCLIKSCLSMLVIEKFSTIQLLVFT